MHDLIPFLPFIIFFALMGVIVSAAIYSEKKRREKLKEYAMSAGLRFEESAESLNSLRGEYKPSSMENYKEIYESDPIYKEKFSFFSNLFPRQTANLDFTGLEIFRTGHSRSARNLLVIPFKGSHLMVFDYKYTVGGGKSSTTYNYTLALFKTKDELPDFTLRPENFLDKIGSVLGFKDINFENYPQFSSSYCLKGYREESTRAFFNDSRISFFQNELGWHCHAGGRFFCAYKKTQRLSPEELPDFIENAKRLLSSLSLS